MKQVQICLLFLLPFLISTQNTFAQPWTSIQKMGSSDQQAQDFLGISTAISDTFMVAGAWWEDGDPFVNSSGAAYIYKLTPAGQWVEIQKLSSPNPESLGYFGFAVAIEGDFLLVTAQNEDEGSIVNAGAVYVYRRESGDVWTLEDRLIANDGQNGDLFGSAIALTKDYALIGSHEHSLDENGENFLDQAGAAYLFKRQSNNTWTQIRKLVAMDRTADANFGRYLDIDNLGLVIGAFRLDHGTSPLQAGAAYAAYCNDSLLIWGYDNVTSADLIKFTASDPGNFDDFGWDVAISGKWAVIGKSGESDLPNGGIQGNTGAAYFFRWENGAWVEKQKVYASDFQQTGQFGRSIGIDGRVCVIGAGTAFEDVAGGDTVFGAGAAYVFELQTNNEWKEVQKLAGTQRTPNDLFGESVDVSGRNIVVSAWSADSLPDTVLLDGGALYMYQRDELLEPLGIAEWPTLTHVRLLDNPTSTGILRIQNTGLPFEGHIQVISMTGQLLAAQNPYLTKDWKTDLSRLPSGTYFVRIHREGYRPQMLKWAKQ